MRKMITEAMIYPMTGALLVMEWTIDKIQLPQSREQEAAALTRSFAFKSRAVLRSRRRFRRY